MPSGRIPRTCRGRVGGGPTTSILSVFPWRSLGVTPVTPLLPNAAFPRLPCDKNHAAFQGKETTHWILGPGELMSKKLMELISVYLSFFEPCLFCSFGVCIGCCSLCLPVHPNQGAKKLSSPFVMFINALHSKRWEVGT